MEHESSTSRLTQNNLGSSDSFIQIPKMRQLNNPILGAPSWHGLHKNTITIHQDYTPTHESALVMKS